MTAHETTPSDRVAWLCEASDIRDLMATTDNGVADMWRGLGYTVSPLAREIEQGRGEDIRRQFEAEFSTGHSATDFSNFCRTHDGNYIKDRIQAIWEGWQGACRRMGNLDAHLP